MEVKPNEQVKDEPIENAPAPDPTAEEAQRALAAMEPPAEAAPKEAEKPSKTPEYAEDPRAAIAAGYRASRTQASGAPAEDVDPNALAARYGTDVVAAPAPAPTATAPAAPADIAPDTLVKVKINGVERTMPYSEVLARAQKVESADAYLSDAKRLKNEVETALAKAAPIKTETGNDGQDDAPSSIGAPGAPSIPGKGTKVDREVLTKVAEAISLGTTEQGAEALGELIEKVAQPAASVDISSQVEIAIAAREVNREFTEAADAFVRKYPDLATDPILQAVGGQLLATEMVKDLIAAGLDKDVIAKQMPTTAHVRTYYESMRVQRPSFGRPMKELMAAAEAAPQFQKLTGGQTPALSVNVDRSDRKAALPPQPAHRSPPALQQQNGNAAPPDLPAKRSSVVQQMQAQRGQRTYA